MKSIHDRSKGEWGFSNKKKTFKTFDSVKKNVLWKLFVSHFFSVEYERVNIFYPLIGHYVVNPPSTFELSFFWGRE